MKTSTVAVLVVAVAAALIIGGIVFALTRSHSNPTTTSTNPPTSSNTSTSSTSNTPASAMAITITYTGNGFSPASSSVKSGGTVTFMNNSNEAIQVDSDPHPAHTDDTDLNVGPIAAGQSKTVTVTKMGNFGFHNHLNTSDTGRITIQ